MSDVHVGENVLVDALVKAVGKLVAVRCYARWSIRLLRRRALRAERQRDACYAECLVWRTHAAHPVGGLRQRVTENAIAATDAAMKETP